MLPFMSDFLLSFLYNLFYIFLSKFSEFILQVLVFYSWSSGYYWFLFRGLISLKKKYDIHMSFFKYYYEKVKWWGPNLPEIKKFFVYIYGLKIFLCWSKLTLIKIEAEVSILPIKGPLNKFSRSRMKRV